MEENVKRLEGDLEERQIVPAPASIESDIMLTDQYVESAGRQIELRSKLLMTGLRALKLHDFQDFDGKPYLEGEGAARIMAVVRGFRVSEAKFKIEIIAPHYFVECELPVEWKGQTTTGQGDCSTADPFFTGRDGNAGIFKRHLDRTGSDAMAARLVLGDAKKKARENALSRAVSELLGLKGLSWADLEQLGFKRSAAGAKVEFKKGGAGGEVKTLSVSEAMTVKPGSIVNVKGILIDWETAQVGKDKKDITKYILHDGTSKIAVKRWGAYHKELGEAINKMVFCGKVQVAEYQGANQYLTETIELTEETTNGNGNLKAENRTSTDAIPQE